MSPVVVVVALVGLQRLLELAISVRNERRLRARGAVEHGARHFPLFILVHGGWLLAILTATPPARWPDPWLLGLFVLLQAARIWVLSSLGERWTTRILVLPGAPLVRRGPYRFLRHPNYVVVALEIAILPLAFGLWQIALTFSILNALLLVLRIHVEERALGTSSAAS